MSAKSGKQPGKTKTISRDEKQAIESLPLPPKTIRMVLWDMDNTLLAMHTRGVWFEAIDDRIIDMVTPTFVHLVPRLMAEGYQVGVVTFSDAEVAKVFSKMEKKVGRGGKDIVIPLVTGALTKHFIRQGMDHKGAATRAKKYVSKLYIVGALPDFRNGSTEEFRETKMPNSKHWHMEQVKNEHQKRYPKEKRVSNPEILFFDDSPSNVRAADEAGVHAVWVNPDDAFTEQDWFKGIKMLERKQ